MKFVKFLYNFSIAHEAIFQNKLRAALTSLGIICGVASVIAMLAIGKGAEEEIINKMKLLGTNNIIIKPLTIKEQEEKAIQEADESEQNNTTSDITKKKKRFSPGLTLADAASIMEHVPGIESIASEVMLETMAFRDGFKYDTKIVGVSESYFEVNNLPIEIGHNFSNYHYDNSVAVCIIGSRLKTKLFPMENPIGKTLKCSGKWLTVIGIIQDKAISKENIQNLGIRDYNLDIYIPINTYLSRFENRAKISKREFERSWYFIQNSQNVVPNYHQLDKLIIKIEDSKIIHSTAEIISRMLKRRHNSEADYEIIIPELLLEQEQKTKSIFNIVLGAIASISLLVGGIGIMNIMLASVMERIKEIGVRLAVGAKQIDIMLQFLSEAIAISLTGGFLGIGLGWLLSLIIEKATGIETIVSLFSIVISFFVSISVGLIFGIMPARKAAKQDPIESLRYE